MIRTQERRAVGTAEGGRMAALYEAHAPAAARLAYLLTGDRALAEDLVHEAFVRLFGRFRDLRQPEVFRAYLRTTVVNLARSHLRRPRVERAYVEREGRAPEASSAGAVRPVGTRSREFEPERIYEVLTIEPLDDGFVVADAERRLSG